MKADRKREVGCTLGARIDPGIYQAYVAWADVYRDRAFKRWTCLLKFDVMDENLNIIARSVPMWLNLGQRDKPHAGRRSRYFQEWFRANGAPPKRADRLPPQVFVRRIARVQIDDAKTEIPYSVVREILTWETGEKLHQPINQSTINVGSKERPRNEWLRANACHYEESSENEERAIRENDASLKIPAPARVESCQPNPTQRRAAKERRPQRQYTASAAELKQFPESHLNERRTLLRQQLQTVQLRQSEHAHLGGEN